jgi:hypothetical protein
MKSIFSSLGIFIAILILFAFGNLREFFDRHLFSILCLVGAIIALIAYIRTPLDDESNTPLPPDKFEG